MLFFLRLWSEIIVNFMIVFGVLFYVFKLNKPSGELYFFVLSKALLQLFEVKIVSYELFC